VCFQQQKYENYPDHRETTHIPDFKSKRLMKKSAWIIAIISLLAVACTTQKQVTSAMNDDVYYSSGKSSQPVASTVKPQANGAQVVSTPDNAKVQKSNSSSFADDYNDYSYSGRINRFNSKDTTKGYFDDTYTNGSTSSNGGNGNVSLYLGLGAGYGGFYSGFGYPYSTWGMDYGWGYPYYGMGMGYGCGFPYYGWYSPWYNPCYYCYGYNDGYYGGYPIYASNNYYGSRRSNYRTDGGNKAPNSRTASNPANANAAPSGRVTSSNARTAATPSRNVVPASQENYRYTRPAANRQTTTQNTTGRNQVQTRNQAPQPQTPPRYTRPENTVQTQRTGSVQSYTSPVYRQPKSSQEYLAPRTQNAARVTNQNTGTRYNSGNSGTTTRQYTTPTRTGSSGNSEPARTNSNYTAPTRSGNSGSYTAPSNQGGSYSPPARSGGNSGSSPSGSGSSGGSGRRR